MKRSVFQGVKTTDLGKKNKLSLNNLLLCVKTNNNVCFLKEGSTFRNFILKIPFSAKKESSWTRKNEI